MRITQIKLKSKMSIGQHWPTKNFNKSRHY